MIIEQKTTLQEQREEAVRQMKQMGVGEKIIKEFIEENKINIMLNQLGRCRKTTDEELKIIKEFEKEHKTVVFFGILTKTFYNMEFLNLFFVNPDKNEWKYDYQNLELGSHIAYVYNLTHPECSEIGDIGIEKTPAGGIIRNW